MDSYQGILDTLQKQLQLNQELLIFSREKLEVLKCNDTAALIALSHDEEKILRQIINLEKERGNLLDKLKNRGEDITNIKELTKRSDPTLAREIESVSGNLKAVIRELQLQNEVNSTIMNFTLEQIEISKNFILSDEAPGNYGKAGGTYGKEKTTADNKFFEGKA